MTQIDSTLLIWAWAFSGFAGYLLIRSWWKHPINGVSLKWTNEERVGILFPAIFFPLILFTIGLMLWIGIGIKFLFTKEWWEEEASW